jgi:hypothetical protein
MARTILKAKVSKVNRAAPSSSSSEASAYCRDLDNWPRSWMGLADCPYFILYRAPIFGGTPPTISQNIDSSISFSPDGHRVAYLRVNSPEVGKYTILTASSDGG